MAALADLDLGTAAGRLQVTVRVLVQSCPVHHELPFGRSMWLCTTAQ